MKTLPFVVTILFAGTVAAQQPQHQGMQHQGMQHQGMQHQQGQGHECPMMRQQGGMGASMGAGSGSAAFGTVSATARRLAADSTTDWSRVNLEALRQHLIDMDLVTLQSQVATREVPGGFEAEVTGAGRTLEAIRRMLPEHARALSSERWLAVSTEPLRNGVRMRVLATDAAKAGDVARARGLGFIGVMTLGDHHAAHHEAIARGAAAAHAH